MCTKKKEFVGERENINSLLRKKDMKSNLITKESV